MKLTATLFVIACMNVAGAAALAADLAPVSPPTDWTGVIVVCVFAALFVGLAAYIVYVKTRAGMQPGEEFIERIAERVHQKVNAPVPPTVVVPINPLQYDGITFPDVAALGRYKATQAEIAATQAEIANYPKVNS